MKTKNLIKIITTWLISIGAGIILFYLLGLFTERQFNPIYWTFGHQIIIAYLIYLPASLVILIITYSTPIPINFNKALSRIFKRRYLFGLTSFKNGKEIIHLTPSITLLKIDVAKGVGVLFLNYTFLLYWTKRPKK